MISRFRTVAGGRLPPHSFSFGGFAEQSKPRRPLSLLRDFILFAPKNPAERKGTAFIRLRTGELWYGEGEDEKRQRTPGPQRHRERHF